MKPYEANMFNAKLIHTARMTDPATFAGISALAKEGREYLKDKKMEVTERESLILMVLALTYNGLDIAAIIRRHIVSCKAFYEELNRQAEEEAKVAAQAKEGQAADPAEPVETENIGGDSVKNLDTPGR